MPSTAVRRPRAARRSGRLAVAAVALVAVLLSACTPESQAGQDLINSSRSQNGRAAVEFQVDLWYKAQAWSDKMAAEQRLYHSNLADGLGHLAWRKLGENVGYGGSISSIHNAFLGSTGHRANILDPAFNYAAVGVAKDSRGRFWVTQVFMRL